MNIKLYIVITALNLVDGTKYVLHLDKENSKELPNQDVTAESNIEDIAHTLCSKYIDLDTLWMNIKCFKVLNNSGTLELYFHGIIPLDTKLLEGAKFYPISTESPYFSPIITEALQHEIF